MTAKDRLIEALRALCEREGGAAAVADEIGANDQTLKQIIAGTKLPSGEPRGVGPNLQRRLEARYPGWAAVVAPRSAGISAAARGIAEALDRLGPPDSLPFLLAYQSVRQLLDDMAELPAPQPIQQTPEPPTPSRPLAREKRDE